MTVKLGRAGRHAYAEAGGRRGTTRAFPPGLVGVTVAVAALVLSTPASPVRGQGGATETNVACPDPVSQKLVMPPELVSAGGKLEGTIYLTEERQRLVTSANGDVVDCAPQRMRVFRGQDRNGQDLPPPPPAAKPVANLTDPFPGPTLRARVGDLVQLKFFNKIDPAFFDPNLDLDKCKEVGQKGEQYPGQFDKHPNCLHASSTANIHFHGTHTNPNSTGDNVYLQIRPLPRNNQGNLTLAPADATASFDQFFKACAEALKNPVTEWPAKWSDLPKAYTDQQMELLKAYQAKRPDQPIFDADKRVLDAGGWPQYYIGAYPYCFGLPPYTADTWPPPAGSTSPIMGQAPGTHWYHAHKHGSTAINVASGMTGAFIIEGRYDDELNEAYGGYTLKDDKRWNTHSQPVLVLNQLSSTPNLLTSAPVGGQAGVDFVVNGRPRPIVEMQPGEIQLWRIVNTSGRNAIYFMAPEGLEWRQLAQDGVQFATVNYRRSHNRPFYMAPANRVDLLVRAPMKPTTAYVRVQNVMARSQVLPNPIGPEESVLPGTILMTVQVTGPAVKRGGQDVQMPWLGRAPTQPKFLADIGDQELRKSNYTAKTLVFNSKPSKVPVQHTINDIQFEDGQAHVDVKLNTVEEWTVKNTTNGSTGPGSIDHPLHIHINPFQVTEFFDPNENLVDPTTGKLQAVVDAETKKTVPVPRYVTDKTKVGPRQCFLDPTDPGTWKPCGPAQKSSLIWRDVFAIPSARVPVDATGQALTDANGQPIVIPGYFKMRSRFVDYPGLYVLHCHILIHEDRGMMFSVEVTKPRPSLLKHH